jgi:hypothetical protein
MALIRPPSPSNPHGRPIQAVTIMKMPSVSTVVSTMTPMISSPNSPCRRGTEPMPNGNKSHAIATNANIGTNASLNGRIANRLLATSSWTVPVLLRCCQDFPAKRSRLSHFRHRCAIPFATITPDHAAPPVFCQHAAKSANSLAIMPPEARFSRPITPPFDVVCQRSFPLASVGREGRTGSFLGLAVVHITKNLSSF